MTFIELVTSTLPILTVVAQVLVVASIVYLLLGSKKYAFVENFINKQGLLFAFIVALIATLGSLFYSEVLGYQPCTLCWYQRILMYPQVILLGLAFWKRDKGIIDYALALSGVGAVIAAYHHLMQIGVVKAGSCGVVGYSVSCAKVFVMHLGYITLPLMALSAFALIIIFLVFAKSENRSN